MMSEPGIEISLNPGFNSLKSQHCRANQETYHYQFPSPRGSFGELELSSTSEGNCFHDALHLGQPCPLLLLPIQISAVDKDVNPNLVAQMKSANTWLDIVSLLPDDSD